MLKLNPAGLSVLELIISLTISSIVMVALLGITTVHISYANQSSAKAQLSVDMMFVMDYFSRIIPSAGGEVIPVWSALIVENNCASRSPFPGCAGSDRLSVLGVANTSTCGVRGSAPGKLLLDNPAGTCCLDTVGLMNTQIAVIKSTNVIQRYVTAVDRPNCSLDVIAGPVAFNDSIVDPLYDWSGATVVPVDLKTYYVDSTTNELVRYTYTNGGAGVDDGVSSPLVDRVLDFQLALGFDFSPPDGVVRDTGDSNDEWLYNDPSNPEFWHQGVFAPASMTQLRMVALGITMGQPGRVSNVAGTRALDGPLVNPPNFMIDREISRFMLRSTRAYQ